MERNRYGKWRPFRELGRGGQGSVWLAHDTERYDGDKLADDIAESIRGVAASISSKEKRRDVAKQLVALAKAYDRAEEPDNCGALKVLHDVAVDGETPEHKDRMKQELEGLQAADHPHIIRLLDAHIDERWFVTEYHPRGSLSCAENRTFYRGNVDAALTAFRGLVEAVVYLHAHSLIHRDIKPGNVFVAQDGRLVLGDLGLIYFADSGRTRVSSTFENVGTRDFMPAWAMGRRVDELRPSFDIFSLGKVLWSMVSGLPHFPLWYHTRDEFSLQRHFPDNRQMTWVQSILDVCVVEEERSCIAVADELLKRVDAAISALRLNILPEGARVFCRVCGTGEYEPIKNSSNLHYIYFQPSGSGSSHPYEILTCKQCGHVDLFVRKEHQGRVAHA